MYAGFFLDDIEIPELDYREDAESSKGGWVSHGFTRNTMVIPQEWLVQIIAHGQERTTVERLHLNPDNSGRWMVNLNLEETAVLAVSGRTRVTTEAAGYWYRITKNDP